MGFTDFLFPPSTPLYPPAATVLTYLESYTDHFDLRPHIHFNTSVISAEYTLNEVSSYGKKTYTWNVSTQSVDSEQQINCFEFDWLLVCNGHYSVPRYPSIPGLSTWVASGKVSHSVTYCNPSLLPLPNSAKVLVIGGGPSGQDIVADLLSSPLIGQVIHSTSSPPTISDVNPRLTNRPRLSQFFTDSSTVQFCDSSIESSISYCILATGFMSSFPFLSDYLRQSIPPPIPPLPDILYNTSYGVFPLPRYLFPLSDTAREPNIAFLGLLMGVAPFPLTQIQARAALTLFEELDLEDPENSKMDWTKESLDILTRYEKLKLKASGNLYLDDEIPLSSEEKIMKKWYRFELMEQFDYRDSLVEFIDRLSSSSASSESTSSSSSASFPSPSLFSNLPFLPGSTPLPSSTSSNLDLNPNSTTSLKKSVPTSSSSSNTLSRFICKKWEHNIYAHKNILRRTWQALERSGEAKEWVRGVGEGEHPEKEWVELVERVIKRGFVMEGGK
jgi:Flavin-binding monooxygenase-like